MAYVSVNELKNRIEREDIEELSNDDTGATDSVALINEVIYDAQDMVNSYVQTRYSTPLSEPVPRVIRDVTSTIAIYYLHLRRDWTLTEAMTKAYNDAMKWLRDLAAGKTMLDIANNSNASGYFGAQTRIFQGVSHDNTTDKFDGF